MKIPAEFEDILRGVELTERETLFLSWITSWDDYTIQNMRTVLGKVITGQILGITPDRLLELAQADKDGKIKAYIVDVAIKAIHDVRFYFDICQKRHDRIKEIKVYLTRDAAEAALSERR